MYLSMMAHWRRVLPGRVLDVRYEDLTSDFEGTTRRVLALCGLPWEESLTRFHENRRPVATHSMYQIRRKLFRRSGSWQAYEAHLQPLASRVATEFVSRYSWLSGGTSGRPREPKSEEGEDISHRQKLCGDDVTSTTARMLCHLALNND
jgi:hypothetical protein